MPDSASSAKVAKTSSRPRWLSCPPTSSGISSDICRPTRSSTLPPTSVSERLLDEVERQAVRFEKERVARFGDACIDVLLQLHVAQEETKSGFSPDELLQLLENVNIRERWPHVRLRGVMGMASFVDDPNQWRKEFRQIRACHSALLDGPLKAQGISSEQFNILSFGMSDDYQVAIEEGTNMVRIGTLRYGFIRLYLVDTSR